MGKYKYITILAISICVLVASQSIVMIAYFESKFPPPKDVDTTELKQEKHPYVWRTGHHELTEENVLNEIIAQGLDYPEIVMAQAIIESNHMRSGSAVHDGNLFGLRKGDGTYHRFSDWTHSVTYYKTHIQTYDSVPKDYYRFLDRLGYAEAPEYVKVIRATAEKIKLPIKQTPKSKQHE